MSKGFLIVIDGTDGSGKATQTALLAKRLKREDKKVRVIDFPRYYDNFFGKFIGECQAGLHGDFANRDPYIASVLYAADRFESSKDITKWLEAGDIVITDRYVSANQIHQGGKIKDPKERRRFLKWLDTMEYEIFGIPHPSAILYLDVPPLIAEKLLKTKSAEKKRKYSQGKMDVVESSKTYRENSRKSALKMVFSNNQWIRIPCTAKGVLMSPQEIHEKIYAEIKKII